jgi:hypothetical protein
MSIMKSSEYNRSTSPKKNDGGFSPSKLNLGKFNAAATPVKARTGPNDSFGGGVLRSAGGYSEEKSGYGPSLSPVKTSFKPTEKD